MASRRALFCCALVLLACDDTPEGTGRVAASITSPVEASVRVVGVEVLEPCSFTGLERLLCVFEDSSGTFAGCAFLELGAPPAHLATTPSEADSACERVNRRERTVFGLPTVTPSSSVELVADPTGERLGVRVDGADEWTIAYLNRGGIEGTVEHTAHTLDWSTVPDFRAALPELLRGAPSAAAEQMLAGLAEREGEEAVSAVVVLLVSDEDLDLDSWLVKQPAPLKRALVALLAEVLKTDPTPGLLERFLALGGVPEAALLSSWAARLDQTGMDDLDDLLELESELRLLIDARHPRAGELSCRLLGGLAAQSVDMQDELGLESGLDSEPVAQASLAGIALAGTPCPWVGELLRRKPCAPELRCATNGQLWWDVQEGLPPEGEDDDENGASLEEDDDLDASVERAARLPLCTPAQARAALTRWKDLVDEGTPGPMLLAAALAQGELPAAVVRRNARRGYRAVLPELKVDDDERSPPCQWIADTLPTFACHAPAEATVVAAGSCEVRFDDAKRTVTLKVLGTPTAPTRPAAPR